MRLLKSIPFICGENEIKDNIRSVKSETANGIIKQKFFKIDAFAPVVLVKKSNQIYVGVLPAQQISSKYTGFITYDFFEEFFFVMIPVKTRSRSQSRCNNAYH